ncbi:NAD(P)H-dependent glycerol-3-phosphate dehydrogenase, partial [Paenibacillus darwinianus]
LAQGLPLEEVLSRMGMVVEGVRTTRVAHELAKAYNVQMPISEQLYAVLFEQKPPKAAVEDLMGRGRTHESEEVSKAWHS